MSLLPKPKPKAAKPKVKTSKKSKGHVVLEGTVEPLAGWIVGFQIIEDKTRTTEHNEDGRFVRFTSGTSWQPDKSVGTVLAYAAVAKHVFE